MENKQGYSINDLKHIKFFVYNDQTDIDFLSVVMSPDLYSVKITDFTTGDITFKTVKLNVLVKYLEEGVFETQKKADIYLYENILERDIVDFEFLYPFVLNEHGKKECYTYEEVFDTINNIRVDFQNKKEKKLFTRSELKKVKFFRYEEDDRVDFLYVEINPILHSARIIEFPERKLITKEVERRVLIDYFFEGEYDSEREAQMFLYENILEKKIIDFDFLYPVIEEEIGKKDSYTYEELINTKNRLKNKFTKTAVRKESVKVKVFKRKKK